jgi:hypothetical protein
MSDSGLKVPYGAGAVKDRLFHLWVKGQSALDFLYGLFGQSETHQAVSSSMTVSLGSSVLRHIVATAQDWFDIFSMDLQYQTPLQKVAKEPECHFREGGNPFFSDS